MNFEKLPRSYCTPVRYRLATYEEARDGLHTIKEKGLLERWERVRLLDGWVSGPGYDFQMGNNFRGCMAFMLVIKLDEQARIVSGTLYNDINLSKDQKEVALMLCSEDWNYEVVYWVLNSLSGSETMDPADVAHGNIPFSNSAQFKEMNTTIQEVAQKFAEEGPASEKAAKREFYDPHSVQEVLGGMIDFFHEQRERTRKHYCIANSIDLTYMLMEDLSEMSLENTWLGDVASQGGLAWEAIADAFWDFLSESYASVMVIYFAIAGIFEICRLNNRWEGSAITSSQQNFIFASYVLFYISLCINEIICAPMEGDHNSFSSLILCYASVEAKQQPELFNKKLQDNTLWRCYEESGSYEVLDKLLLFASKGQTLLQKGKRVDILLVDRLLKCGAKPGRSLRSCKNKTALHYAAKLKDEKVAKCLLSNCDANQLKDFVNAKDVKGRTALHRATEMGNIPVCKLLLDYGARLDSQDNYGQSVLHNAVEFGEEEVIDCVIENPNITTCLQLKNIDDDTPLDLALAGKNSIVVAALLWKSDKPEDHFSNVDIFQILSQSLLKGYVKLVKLLLQREKQLSDAVDDQGKTMLHLAIMCEKKEHVSELFHMILRESEDEGKLMEKCDTSGRTILHEAALKGDKSLCQKLLEMNPSLMDVKDKSGRNALYDAVQGNLDDNDLWDMMFRTFRRRGGKLDAVIDRSGLTPLHVAAEKGREKILKQIVSIKQGGRKHIKRADFLGQTALHKAAKSGNKQTMDILLEYGANPFQERDCDGRTALHYVVEAKTGEEGKELTNLLLKKCKSPEEKLLFLWASAAGVGPADKNLTDPEIKEFLSHEKNSLLQKMKSHNLLQVAARIGNTRMAKELLSRGCQIANIKNAEWHSELTAEERANVKRVTTQIEKIAEQGNDLPTIEDNLERSDYAHGLAALLLNPFLKPPIAVGISGDWGKGKSSLMIQTEKILLETVAQMALLPSSQLPRSTSDVPGVEVLKLSKKGQKRYNQIKRQVDMLEGFSAAATTAEADSLVKFLSNYEPKHRHIFKSLAVMDSTKMFTTISQEQSVPAIITVQYNAWKYRNETEALAGLAVEITKEIEGSMTDSQWLTACFRNAWRKHKHSIWIDIIFPCLLAFLLAGSFIWIVWLVFDRYKLEKWAKAKYACVPAAIVVVVWILAKSVLGVLKPVSSQLMNYISFPDHADKLGYQERVIADITFLKDELGKKPSKLCTAMVKLSNIVIMLTLWFAAFSSSVKCGGNTRTTMKFRPAHRKDLRIIVFVDDLDRCQESVILQVLAAINLVLAVCEINVVLGMDKKLLERAIMKKYWDSKAKKELADNYLQKIIQLPLDLPDPSKEQFRSFLQRHMGVVHLETDDNDTESIKDGHKIKKGQIRKLLSLKAPAADGIRSAITHCTECENQPRPPEPPTSSFSIDVDSPRGEREMRTNNFRRPSARATLPKPIEPNVSDEQNTGKAGNEISNRLIPIPIREMLFVTYSSGEWDAIHYFQELATNCRKLPREWKRFLNYHRLVWNIFSINVVEKPLVGWQVQLISWIFICWEWKENMDFLIQDWCNGGVLKTLTSDKPSLGIIVEHFIEGWGSNNINKAEDSENRKSKPEEKDGVDNREQRNKDKKMTESSYQEDTAPTTQDPEEKESRLDQPEVDMKEEMRAIKERLYSLEKSVEELKNTIDELKMGKGTKHATPKNENRVDGGKIKQKDMLNWRRLRSALDKYDVTMEGIQAFQRFRFHCVPGHLQWPLLKQEWEA